jgi:hypothetical protein
MRRGWPSRISIVSAAASRQRKRRATNVRPKTGVENHPEQAEASTCTAVNEHLSRCHHMLERIVVSGWTEENKVKKESVVPWEV